MLIKLHKERRIRKYQGLQRFTSNLLSVYQEIITSMVSQIQSPTKSNTWKITPKKWLYKYNYHFTDDTFFGCEFQSSEFFRSYQSAEEVEAGNVATIIVKDYCAIIGLDPKDLENQGILA